jgi:predicted O-methyltransferase YrrM
MYGPPADAALLDSVRNMNDAVARSLAIARVIRDPPQAHPKATGGVWRTNTDCYEFLARYAEPGARTLETGLGLSTGLFAVWGTEHTCVVPDPDEVERLKAWADERGIDRSRMTFEVGLSDQILPRMEPTELDLVFVDGGHSWPMAIIDFYYAAGRLRDGGVVVFDDIQLPHVRLGLFEFLQADPRWEPVVRTDKWAACIRHSSGPLAESHLSQEFLEG